MFCHFKMEKEEQSAPGDNLWDTDFRCQAIMHNAMFCMEVLLAAHAADGTRSRKRNRRRFTELLQGQRQLPTPRVADRAHACGTCTPRPANEPRSTSTSPPRLQLVKQSREGFQKPTQTLTAAQRPSPLSQRRVGIPQPTGSTGIVDCAALAALAR